MHNSDHAIKPNVDHCLIQLADMLRKIGVDEMEISESGQHHTIYHEKESSQEATLKFCKGIADMYASVMAG